MTMRIFVAGLATETNTFSPIPTSIEQYEEGGIFRPGELPDEPLGLASPSWVARGRASTMGWDVVEGTCAYAEPAGITTRDAYESLRDEILEQLKSALPVDAVALGMHGAMVADGYPDCEGDMMMQVRTIVGENVAIGVELDPHCHLTNAMTDNADAIVIFKEYPHTDFLERAEELLDILDNKVKGRVKPVMSTYDCRMLSMFHTRSEPMRGFVQRMKDLEQQDHILSISVVHGFPWGDVVDIGTRILVVSDDSPAKGAALAKQMGQELFALRGKTFTAQLSLENGIGRALTPGKTPLLIADTCDNPGGGAPGDSTFILRELLQGNAEQTCLGPIWDPMAVRTAFSAGIGAKFDMRIGGKSSPASGQPLDAHVEVTALCRDAYQSFAGSQDGLGDCAAIRIAGVDVVLISIRTQAMGLELFTNLGIDPAAYRVVVVKSSQHFRHEFDPIAAETIYINSPGTLAFDYSSIPYTKLDRPMWPLVEDPLK